MAENEINDNEDIVDNSVDYNKPDDTRFTFDNRRIRSINIIGNKLTPTPAIAAYLPYGVGEMVDPIKTRQFINTLYQQVGRFAQIEVKGVPISSDQLDLYVVVREKTFVKSVTFSGNSKLSESEIKKKIDFDFAAIDEAEGKVFAERIKTLYREKGYTNAVVTATLHMDPTDGKAVLAFTMEEGKLSIVKQIKFQGNSIASSKELRSVLFTKEDWILSFLDGAGSFHPERLEGDKYMVEQYYQNRGFLQSNVSNIAVETDACNNITLTFYVEEGSCYTIDQIEIIKGDLPLVTECIIPLLPVKTGEIYSRERVMDAVKALETLCGDFGYIFAQVIPSPQIDDIKKTVSLSFVIQPGEQIYLNRITIRGNQKTRDPVIRRQLTVQEGTLLSQAQLDSSKRNVEALGYFEPRDGVNWKIHRIGTKEADLDLILHEARTGNFGIQASVGGSVTDMKSPVTGLTVKGVLADPNLFGKGINFNLEGSWAYEEQTISFHLGKTWLFDKPLSGAIDVYHRRPTYDDLQNIIPQAVNEKLTGFGLMLGFITRPGQFFGDTNVLFSAGLDAIDYQVIPRANISGVPATVNATYQEILNNEFVPGKFAWLSNSLEQSTINHPMHASRGHKWRLSSRLAIPVHDKIGFYKITFDYHWFTSIIDEYNLVFHLRGFYGLVVPLKNKTIPFEELFHVGGQSTVRGWLYGQIGPRFFGDSIGSQNALFVNAELIFPITPDFNMKGVVFYDGGAGWSNPNADRIHTPGLRNNSFDYRHAVGFGLRLLSPTPVRVDIGFKLDPRKDRVNPRDSETGYEIHFGMNYSW